MRLRRLCEVKPSGRCYVDEATREDYANLERREWLELALVQSLKIWNRPNQLQENQGRVDQNKHSCIVHDVYV